jgi:hypothetical protein
MALGIGASGIAGVAFETVAGTYVAPTKYVPILNETLEYKESNIYRRPIRQSAAQIGVVPGDFNVTGTITDMDTFSFEVDDAGNPNMRLKAARGSAFTSYGERSVQMTAARDFLDATDYNAFKAVTPQHGMVSVAAGANNGIQFDIYNAVKDVYQVPLSGQGDLVRANITYQSTLDSSGNEYQIVYKTQEIITPHT